MVAKTAPGIGMFAALLLLAAASVKGGPVEFRSPYPNETHWLLDATVRDATEMIVFASTGKVMPAGALRLSVTPDTTGTSKPPACAVDWTGPQAAGKLHHDIAFQRHLFAAETYTPWVAKLIEALKLKPDAEPASGDERLITDLLQPTSTAVVAASRRVSDALTRHPLAAGYHDQAAFIVGVQALRDASARYADPRHPLCRMAAHLAIARALQPKPGACGQLAETIQLVLAGRQTEALEKITQLPTTPAAWPLALKVRVTGDYRTPPGSTLFEQISHANALVASQGPASVLKFLRTRQGMSQGMSQSLPEIDLMRLTLASGFGVEAANVVSSGIVEAEVKELEKTWRAMADKDLADADMITQLNVERTGGVVATGAADGTARLASLSWGTLADFHQRHLCFAMGAANYALSRLLGIPQQSRAQSEDFVERFGQLRLYPLVQGAIDADSASRERVAHLPELIKLGSERPELLPLIAWGYTANPPRPDEVIEVLNQRMKWPGMQSPWGTFFSFLSHENYGAYTRRGAAWWEEVRAQTPYNDGLLMWRSLALHGQMGTAKALEDDYGPILDFNLTAMRRVGQMAKDDLAIKAKYLEKGAAIEGDMYFALADTLRAAGAPDEKIAHAYEQGLEKATSWVMMSNSMQWLVRYYLDHDRPQDAEKVAQRTAAVYSARGLSTAAYVMERLNRRDEAEKLYLAIKERYEKSAHLLSGFWGRNRTQDPRYEQEWAAVQTKVFPDGLESAAAEISGNEAPADGMKVINGTRGGLGEPSPRSGDIVVAVNGQRIHTLEQLRVLVQVHLMEPVSLVYWDGKTYQTCQLSDPLVFSLPGELYQR